MKPVVIVPANVNASALRGSTAALPAISGIAGEPSTIASETPAIATEPPAIAEEAPATAAEHSMIADDWPEPSVDSLGFAEPFADPHPEIMAAKAVAITKVAALWSSVFGLFARMPTPNSF